MLGEQQDVLPTLAQRGQADGEHGEAIVEVVAEAALGHRRVEVAVGRGDEADVGLEGRRAAHPLVLTFLEHAEELALHGRRQLADLVEEQRAAGGQLEAPAPQPVRAGEGAALVAEQLRLEEGLRERRAVHRDERARRRARSPDGSPGPAPPSRSRSRR